MTKLIALLAMIAAHSSYDTSQVNRQQIYCLATAVYHEARGEPIEGQVAVAHAILNRVESYAFPDTPCRVIYQPRQFTDIHLANPDYDTREWELALEAAIFATLGIVDDPTEGSDHYYNPAKAQPYWSASMTKIAMIGNHKFLKSR